MKDRILKIIEHENLAPSRFAEEIGIQRSAMSHIISGRNNASLDVLMKIIQRFPYVDTEWLLFGKGSMIKSTSAQSEPSLFAENEIFPVNVQPDVEYRKEIEVSRPEIYPKQTHVEQIRMEEKVSKTVSKIMVFYSDNTFETFTPEKNKKEKD